MSFPDKGDLLDLLKGSVITLALFLAYAMVPLVGILPGIFTPLPAMYYGLKGKMATGVAIVTVAAVVLAVMGEWGAVLLYLLQFGVISISLPRFLAAGRGGGRSIAYSGAINLVLILLLAVIYGVASGENLHVRILKGIQSSISQTASLYEKAGVKGEDLQGLQQGMEQAGELIGRIYPALVAVTLAFIAGLNVLLLGRLTSRLARPVRLGSFTSFKNPEQLVWLLIVAGFAMLVPAAGVKTAALNLLVVTVSLYFIQGMAIIGHFFARLAVPRFVRFVFYLVLAMQPYLAVPVAALGIFDIWGDFRTPKKPQNL